MFRQVTHLLFWLAGVPQFVYFNIAQSQTFVTQKRMKAYTASATEEFLYIKASTGMDQTTEQMMPN